MASLWRSNITTTWKGNLGYHISKRWRYRYVFLFWVHLIFVHWLSIKRALEKYGWLFSWSHNCVYFSARNASFLTSTSLSKEELLIFFSIIYLFQFSFINFNNFWTQIHLLIYSNVVQLFDFLLQLYRLLNVISSYRGKFKYDFLQYFYFQSTETRVHINVIWINNSFVFFYFYAQTNLGLLTKRWTIWLSTNRR